MLLNHWVSYILLEPLKGADQDFVDRPHSQVLKLTGWGPALHRLMEGDGRDAHPAPQGTQMGYSH